MVEERGDSFYIMDPAGYDASVADVVNSVAGMDSNYTAVYYPWVRIVDSTKNKPVWVPPSVVLPGVFAFNDRVAAEWYAPAGLNRGGLPEVIDAKVRLSQPSRDTLYENRINPIGSFPGQGVCVWGQKTLQGRPSALDRINVRRMMIAVKKFIAASTRFLVFEQNTAATRNRFLNIVNPYLESIQQRQGLSAFRVIMDETNNTPDVIDRNIMYGVLYLQPTKTAEFIQLDFNIQPTGAEFPE
jgi:phage tail sheath protein FI